MDPILQILITLLVYKSVSVYVTPPRTVPSQLEKGGGYVEPALPPRKENYTTETCTTKLINETNINTFDLEEVLYGETGRDAYSVVLCDRRMPMKLKGKVKSDQLCCMVQRPRSTTRSK